MGRRSVEVYVTSAFSKNNRGGNRAGVVLKADHLPPDHRMAIAKELGYSETAFVSNSRVADFQLSYFTPTEEVPLCGHATIAAFSTLWQLGMLNKEKYTIETRAGILEIQIRMNGLIFMEQNCPVYSEVLDPKELSGCIGKPLVDSELPIQIVSTGLRDIMLPVKSIGFLEELRPDFERIKKLSSEKGVIGIHAFTIVGETDVTAICRNFAPLYGIDEESATGTSNCALACYLFKYYKKKTQYVFEQGRHMGAASQIVVEIAYHDDIIDSVHVGGYGYLLCKKSLCV